MIGEVDQEVGKITSAIDISNIGAMCLRYGT